MIINNQVVNSLTYKTIKCIHHITTFTHKKDNPAEANFTQIYFVGEINHQNNMLPELSDDVLIFIITLVATSSLKDLLNLSKTCKVLKKHCLNAEVAHCCALDTSLTRNMYKVDGNRDSLYQLLESSRNPEYCFRMGILDICYQISNYDSTRNFLEMALQQGHDGAKYTLAILNIFSGNVENHGKGRTSLTELWFQKKLYKCRHMIREAINSDGY